MNPSEKILAAWERSTRGLAKRPHLGKVTRSVMARITDGLTCAIEAEEHHLVADLPEVAGGNDPGLPPSLYLKVAFASFLAIGYRQRFAALSFPVDNIEVQVTGTIDACGMYGLDDTRLAYDGPLQYTVHVESPADEDSVVEVLNWVDAHSFLTNVLRNPVELQRTVNIARTGE